MDSRVRGNDRVWGTRVAPGVGRVQSRFIAVQSRFMAAQSCVIPGLTGDPGAMDSRVRGNDRVLGTRVAPGVGRVQSRFMAAQSCVIAGQSCVIAGQSCVIAGQSCVIPGLTGDPGAMDSRVRGNDGGGVTFLRPSRSRRARSWRWTRWGPRCRRRRGAGLGGRWPNSPVPAPPSARLLLARRCAQRG